MSNIYCPTMIPDSCPVPTAQLLHQQELNFSIVSIFRMVFASISLLFSITTIIIYLILKLHQIPFFKVIMLLCFSDIIYSIQCFLMWNQQSNLFDKTRCQSQAFLATWANISQQGWMLVIAIILFSENEQLKHAFDIFTRKRWFCYFSLGIGIPTLIAIPGFFDIYSPQKFYCWITNPKSQIMCNPQFLQKVDYFDFCNMFIIGVTFAIYLYVWGTIIANAIVYIVMVKRIKERIEQNKQKRKSRIMTILRESYLNKDSNNDDGEDDQEDQDFQKRYKKLLAENKKKYSYSGDDSKYYDDDDDDNTEDEDQDTYDEQNLRRNRYSRRSSIVKVQANMSYKILRFPLAQLLIWFFPTLNGIIGMFHPTSQIFILILSILHVSSMASTGIVNSIIYGWNQVVKLRLQQCRKYGRQKSVKSMELEVEPLMTGGKLSLQRYKD